MTFRIILNSIKRSAIKRSFSRSVLTKTETEYFDNMSAGLIYYSCEDPAIAEKMIDESIEHEILKSHEMTYVEYTSEFDYLEKMSIKHSLCSSK